MIVCFFFKVICRVVVGWRFYSDIRRRREICSVKRHIIVILKPKLHTRNVENYQKWPKWQTLLKFHQGFYWKIGFDDHHISSHSFCGNYSFLNLEVQRSQYMRSTVTVHKSAETIQGWTLYEEIRWFKWSDRSCIN